MSIVTEVLKVHVVFTILTINFTSLRKTIFVNYLLPL